MNEALRLTALYVRDLLAHPESLIKIGRLGENIEDFATDYIGVDSLGAATRMASGQKYDGNAEEMTYAQQWQLPVTLSFYGNNTWGHGTKLAVLIPSQKSYELQQSLGLGVFQASQLTDVKILTGQQYGNRYELALNIRFSISAIVDTLRIDTAQIELRTQTGVEIEP